ncbi:SDR family oxidoreductase [Aldersonia sp. NBC_00410]|uniref:SDR family oxidoreductase n=1 Tax=Aldersonia sp. NBC_00410 TaxID=2975954 RepID=UPI00224D8967|nr:SDR family oxidoreductase [Aldersonia sp. NBC_00410]MCX5042003.1 SDR family oxidoreductase [Aldersonia sp. NBC_00410]
MSRPTVFISGAAAGIGRATAHAFARLGYHVGAFDIDEPGLGLLRDEIEAIGGSVRVGLLNVTDAAQWDSALAQFHADEQRLDVLINNAGVLASGRFEEMDIATHRRMVDINVNGVVNGSRAAFGYLRETPSAQLVNLCSASAIYGQPELATYSATKFAVRGLTEALDLEWRPYDIRVIAVWPMFVRTAMVDGMDTGTTRSLGIHLTAEDVADGIVDAVGHRPRLLRKVHYPIGRQAKAFANLAKFSPDWATRLTNKRMSHT